jgi:predicted amidohydrolase
VKSGILVREYGSPPKTVFMKICLAQTHPRTGVVEDNIERHLEMVQAAGSHGADLIVFPELSLTGYEPKLAGRLAIELDDERLDRLQRQSDAAGIVIACGAPIRAANGVQIGLIILQPGQPRRLCVKHYLHADEEPYFVAGERFAGLERYPQVAFAICYEISVPEHAARAARGGARVYVASVAKAGTGVESAIERLASVAREHRMIAAMANCVGMADGLVCGGRSMVWDARGAQLGQLDDREET